MFLNNKYLSWYNSIIANAKSRILSGYKEQHHVIPRSLGGSDDISNLVFLTAREHFICHCLLTKMTIGQSYHKMLRAFIMMKASNNKQPRYTSSLYESARTQFSILQRENQSGTSNNNYGRKWIYHDTLKISKVISKDCMESYLSDGWKIGRKIRCKEPVIKKKQPKHKIKYRNTKLGNFRKSNGFMDPLPDILQGKNNITGMKEVSILLGFDFLAENLESEYYRCRNMFSTIYMNNTLSHVSRFYGFSSNQTVRFVARMFDLYRPRHY